jgi:hypothetical protein
MGGTLGAEAGLQADARAPRIPISFKVPPALRATLGEISRLTGRSIAAECETRLLETFRDEQTFDQVLTLLYGPRLADLVRELLDVMRLVGAARLTLIAEAAPDVLDDPWRYDQVVRAINHILEAHRPAGEIKEPAAVQVKGLPRVLTAPHQAERLQALLRDQLDEERNIGVRTAERRLRGRK